MKNIKINKDQAIAIMRNILRDGCAIPMTSISDGGCRFGHVGPILMVKDILWFVSLLRDETFRNVPVSEFSEEFSCCDLSYYDICVEFTNSIGDYSEQYLLWDIDYYGD